MLFLNVYYSQFMQLYPISYADDGIRLERFFQKTFPQVPMSMRQKFFREKKIAVFRDKKRLKPEKSLSLRTGDLVKIFFNLSDFGEKKEISKSINWQAILKNPKLSKTKILFQDEHLLLVNKPAGVSVHPGSGVAYGHSLIDYCTALQKSSDAMSPEPKLIHRLDKDTSGLVMIGKHDAIVRKMVDALQKGHIIKKYYALVRGKLEKPFGTITEKIERKETSRSYKITISNTGKDSVTHYTVLHYYPSLHASFIEVTLETGRMHQIRIHFASQHHPLAGDSVYGDFEWNKALERQYGLKRQFLHAFSLQFVHPYTKKSMEVRCDLPADLKMMIPA